MSPRAQLQRLGGESVAWIATAMVASIGIAVGLFTFDAMQDAVDREAAFQLRDLRQARLDLARGVVAADPADPLTTPDGIAGGLALERQAAASFKRILPRLQVGGELSARFERELGSFDALTWAVQRAPQDRRLHVQLRAQIHALDRMASEAEAATRARLGELRSWHRTSFVALLTAAAILLGVIVFGLVRALSRQASARLQLIASEQRFSQMFDQSPIAICMFDGRGNFLAMNRQFTQLFGCSPDETADARVWLGRALPDADCRASVVAYWNTAAEAARHSGQLIEPREVRFIAQGGQERQVMVKGSRVGDDLLVSFVDVTVWRETEAALHEAEARMSRAFEVSPDALVVHDAGRIESVNAAAAHVFGVANVDEIIGRSTTEFLAAAAVPVARERIARLMLSQERLELKEYVQRRADGSEILVETVSASFQTREGMRIVTAYRDITDLERAQGELKRSNAMLLATLESTDNGIFVTDQTGQIIQWNAKLVELLHLPSQHSPQDLPAAIAQRLHAVIRAFGSPLPGPGADRGACIEETADGRILELYTQCMLTEGEEAGRVWSLRDVTARERALRDATSRRDELERRVRERTKELTMANAELDAFSDAVSHDLRGPLAAVGAFVTVVLEKHAASIDARGLQYLQKAFKATRVMAEMIDALLALSRNARQPLDRRDLRLDAISSEVLEVLLREPDRHVEVRMADHMPANGDPALLRNLMQNLLANAIKYSRHSDPATIEVGMERLEGQDVFFVRDNGVGFDPDYAMNLFKPFSRLHTQDQFEGLGIGLATAKRIVERHGGRIWAESLPGVGATFRFTLSSEPGPSRAATPPVHSAESL